jgi:(p)ppGpp synthase/HD superfamily hydrolase
MSAHLSQPSRTPPHWDAWPWSGLQRSHRALRIATEAHHKQLRKDGSPFLLHPLAVWQNLMQVELADPHVLGLALVHDVLEERPLDAAYFEQRIAHELGADTARHVRWLSDKPGRSTERRKQDQLRKLRHAPWPVRVVKLADRLTNLQSGPAPGWSAAKTQAYAEHSLALLDVLDQAHVELAFYIRHTLAQPAWLGDMPASDALKTRG